MMYAGIGARKTPPEIIHQMRHLGNLFGGLGIGLQSGGAIGADKAFEFGCNAVGGRKRIFTTDQTLGKSTWFELAKIHHPAWDRCSDYAQRLHARNCPIVMGEDLRNPVDFVVCWTPNGAITGGTGQALRIADFYKIPIYNLFYPANYQNFCEWSS